jgi:anthranilate phosphoribosyltransferase
VTGAAPAWKSLVQLVGGKADSLKEGIAMAAKSIDDGAALKVLENLVAFSQKAAQ